MVPVVVVLAKVLLFHMLLVHLVQIADRAIMLTLVALIHRAMSIARAGLLY